jgi:hypothetical protein
MTKSEKKSFVEAAKQTGLDLSSWMRVRLRQSMDRVVQKKGNDIVAEDHSMDFGGVFANDPIFEKGMNHLRPTTSR